MTDLEITKLCAEAMGYQVNDSMVDGLWAAYKKLVIERPGSSGQFHYDPLHFDEHAMALVKKLKLHVTSHANGDVWMANFPFAPIANFVGYHTESSDLNRAICECVAKMQIATHPART